MDNPDTTTFEALADVIGKAAAINLCQHYGGETLYIRKTMNYGADFKRHWETFYGKGVLSKISQLFGGERCYIPKAPPMILAARNRAIVERMDNGESRSALAKEFLLTPRAVAVIYLKTIEEDRL